MSLITAPAEIEKRSFEIISEELGERSFEPGTEMIVKRVIHTTADFEYADNLKFLRDPVKAAEEAVMSGGHIITDTNMALAGINKSVLKKFGVKADCFMADETVKQIAERSGITRASAAMMHAIGLPGPLIFVIGNAPTALITLDRLIREGRPAPALIIAVPVGFVNVTEAKQLIADSSVPAIIAEGRKGGSTVAAAIMNAILYQMDPSRGK